MRCAKVFKTLLTLARSLLPSVINRLFFAILQRREAGQTSTPCGDAGENFPGLRMRPLSCNPILAASVIVRSGLTSSTELHFSLRPLQVRMVRNRFECCSRKPCKTVFFDKTKQD